jgi:hypothetical protein
MGYKREFLQRYPPDVLLLLDGSSDIHYGKNHKKFRMLWFNHAISPNFCKPVI